MKRIASLTGILLVVMAGAAFAAGLNLGWDTACPLGASDKNVTCADATPASTLMGTFVLGADFPGQPTGVDNTVDVQVNSPTPTTFWNAGSGIGLGTRYAATFAAGSCPNWYGLASVDNAHSRTTAGNRTRLKVVFVLGEPGVNVPAGQETGAFALSVNMGGATADAAGCNSGACIVYNDCFIEDAFNGTDTRLTNAQTRQHATWKAAVLPPTFCPAATPASKKTWGAIKAIYR